MSKLTRLCLPMIAIGLVACSGGGAASSSSASGAPPSAAPSGSPSESPAVGAIEHPTGATDVVLRYEEGGGFMMPAFIATQAPIFTLYGDGTVIFRDPLAEQKQLSESVFASPPFRTAKLSEDQVQDLLEYALGAGGLGAAKREYTNDMVADAGTAIFTLDAGGLQKTVSVYALGLDTQGVADAPARAAFATLAKSLSDFDQGGSVATDLYVPERYRGVLMDGFAAPDQIEWPFNSLTPDDFEFPADPNEFQRADRVMTPAEVAELGFEDVEGGFQNLPIQSPDGTKLYTFSLRPLLPDEEK